MTTNASFATFREEQILAHLPQVRLLARRLHRRCPQVELDDLVSVGTIGLIKAVDHFDPSQNFKLKTYAEHRISGALLDYLRQLDPLPRAVRQFQKRRDALIQASPETRDQSELARALDVSEEKYVKFSRMITASQTCSLDDAAVRRLTG